MIKLIATDMDGTLLNRDREIDPEFFQVLEHLRSKNILVALISGREYYSLIELVPDTYRKELIFASNNGNYIEFQDEVLFESYMKKESLQILIEKLDDIKDARVLMCTKNSVFTNSVQSFFIGKLKNRKIQFLKQFKTLDEQVIKCTIFTEEGNQENILKQLSDIEHLLEITPSGKKTIDITSKNINKGTALELLQDKYKISKNETMVFGDYLNDIPMMDKAFYSYAMSNAHPDLKEIATFTADYHYNRGVIDEIVKRVI